MGTLVLRRSSTSSISKRLSVAGLNSLISSKPSAPSNPHQIHTCVPDRPTKLPSNHQVLPLTRWVHSSRLVRAGFGRKADEISNLGISKLLPVQNVSTRNCRIICSNVSYMNIGDGETSYAENSGLQRAVILKTLPVLDDTLKDMFVDPHFSSQKLYKLVDFGCASGPNSLFAMKHIIGAIENMSREKSIDVVPEFEVYLNDLPGNDFNNLFKLLPSLHGKEKGQRFVYGLPGSFYGILFPKKTIHFGYSSYSLHWLSQVPEGLGSANKENIYLALESPPEVVEAYSKQFQRDFSTFLRSRAEEMIHGGRMVLSFIGRSHESTYDDSASGKLKLLAETFVDMAKEGRVTQEDLHSFNMPHYEPCKSEVRAIVEDEGSFTLDRIEDFLLPWDANNNANRNEVADDTLIDNMRGEFVAHCVRAFMEPLITKHFGNSILDELFERYAKKVGDYMSLNKTNYFTIVISLTRK